MEKCESVATGASAPDDAWDDDSGSGGGNEQFSDGLMHMLKPIIIQLDSHIQQTRNAQIGLRQHIDSLAQDLRTISTNQSPPYDIDVYVKKLQETRKRVAVVSSILQNAQDRLLKLQRNTAKETSLKKLQLDGPAPPSPN